MWYEWSKGGLLEVLMVKRRVVLRECLNVCEPVGSNIHVLIHFGECFLKNGAIIMSHITRSGQKQPRNNFNYIFADKVKAMKIFDGEMSIRT